MTYSEKTQSASDNSLANQGEALVKHRVVGLVADSVVIRADNDSLAFDAKCAVSCLLKPIPGDLVLVHSDTTNDEHYVLAVLERPTSSVEQEYVLAPGVSLKATNDQLQIHSESLDIQASRAEFRIGRFTGVYNEMTERAQAVKLVATNVTHHVGRFMGRLRDSFRLVDGIDRTQATNIEQTAEHQLLLKSNITKIRSQHMVKVDAKKIDLG